MGPGKFSFVWHLCFHLFLVVPIISYRLSTVGAVNESSGEFVQGLVEAGLMSRGCDAVQFDDSTESHLMIRFNSI